MLKYLGTKIDNWGWRKKMKLHCAGWASRSVEDIKFYRSAKVQYRYRERGEGQTIVFAADPPATLEFYDDLIDTYSRRFRVIVVEMPGMGFSQQQGNYGFKFCETNDDLAEFIRAVAGEKSILAFSCVAGLGSVDIAVRYPELVEKLVLIQSVDYPQFLKWKAARDPKKILAKPILGQLAMKKLAYKRVPMWLGMAVGKREKLEPFCACALHSIEHGSGWAMASAFQNYIADAENSATILGKAKQPILAIWGNGDRSHPDEAIKTISNLGNLEQVVQFSDLGHFPELEGVDQVFDVISTFAGASTTPA
jgi:pimeloyl-ACP methyl ester carboxylesterase